MKLIVLRKYDYSMMAIKAAGRLIVIVSLDKEALFIVHITCAWIL